VMKEAGLDVRANLRPSRNIWRTVEKVKVEVKVQSKTQGIDLGKRSKGNLISAGFTFASFLFFILAGSLVGFFAGLFGVVGGFLNRPPAHLQL